MNKRIWLSPPHMGGSELKYIQEAFATNWISPVGPHIENFEHQLVAYNNAGFCAALSSGSAAIHLALMILGVEAGDEVICSSFTFSASCNPICYLNAIPVFVDSEKETWNMNPALLEDAINQRLKHGKKPKAIVLVHLYGMPAKMKEIMEIADRFDIPVVEDAAEALGSTYNDKKLGTFGRIGVYSFNGNKIITTSGGGALVSQNEGFVKRTKYLATQARQPATHYEHTEIGYNYRLSNISAGIGLGQLEVLPERIRQRRSNYEFYRHALKNLPLSFLEEPAGAFSNRWLTTISVNSQDVTLESIRLALEKEQIESRPLWKPMHLQPVFKDCPAIVDGTSETLFKTGLCLPSGSSMTTEDLNRVCAVIRLAYS